MAEKSNANEISITRFYRAPLKTVWNAWTDVEQVAKWWGPRGFTLTTHSKELKPGGIWHYTMHGPDGVDYPNKTLYHEVVEYARLVYDHGGNDERAPLFRVTALFSEVKGGTQMDMTMRLPTAEAAEETHKRIKKFGGNSTWDRLAEYLAKTTSGKENFVINRTFDAPVETLFEVWTNPKHASQWLSPAGTTTRFMCSDVRPGGSAFYVMTDGKSMKMYGRVKYIEVDRPHRIVHTQQFCDENENVSRHPLSATWPETMLTQVEFTAEGPSRTRVTLTWEPQGEVTAVEWETFTKARGNMTQGWTGSFDGLEDYLRQLPTL
jgi:uncharacterized protein YndB with AHSA1/START domain